jgi:hypothetical protein
MQFPSVVRTGTPFLQIEGDAKPFIANEITPVLRLLSQALSTTFASVKFELILHAIEQLLPLASMQTSNESWGQFHPAIGAFVEMSKRYENLADSSLLTITRESVIAAIHTEIYNRSFQLPTELPLHKLFIALAQEFRIAIFTLNYDDVVDGACPALVRRFCRKKGNFGRWSILGSTFIRRSGLRPVARFNRTCPRSLTRKCSLWIVTTWLRSC